MVLTRFDLRKVVFHERRVPPNNLPLIQITLGPLIKKSIIHRLGSEVGLSLYDCYKAFQAQMRFVEKKKSKFEKVDERSPP